MAWSTETSLEPQRRKHPNRFHQDYYDPGGHGTWTTGAIRAMTDNGRGADSASGKRVLSDILRARSGSRAKVGM